MRSWLFVFGLSIAVVTASAAPQVNPSFKPYTAKDDLSNIANAKKFLESVPLGEEHIALLKKNLFVCFPSDHEQLYWVYANNDYLNLPTIVTSDAVLQLYHVFFDSTLRWVEENRLEPILRKMTHALLLDSIKQYNTATDPLVKKAALKNVAYFGFAARSLGDNTAVPTAAKADISKDLALAESHKGFDIGGVFPYKIDYSQFIVRGHYTRTPKLKRFFKAMMWYGLAPMTVRYDAGGKTVVGRTQLAQMALASLSLESTKQQANWMSVYEPTTLYAGLSNDLAPQKILQLTHKVYGPKPSLNSIGNATKLNAFMKQVLSLPEPKIMARMSGQDLPLPDHLFRFMGQRAIPDSIVMQRLTGETRGVTSGLDVMAVLGSAPAKKILDDHPEIYMTQVAEYVKERPKLVKEFAALPKATWNSNLYYGWLYALKALLEPTPAGYPSFMRNNAWEEKNLNTALGSWSELRHDTILHGLQSVAEAGDGEEPPFVPEFVEPCLDFYTRLLNLTKMSQDGLLKRNLLNKEFAHDFKEFIKMLEFLKGVSIKELNGVKLTKEEHTKIRYIESDLEGLTQSTMITANGFQALTEDDLDMALIADVHTARDKALEVGVGRAMQLVAVVPIEGKLYLARGSAMSFYEFWHPISDRLTDEKWKKMLREKQAPPQPFWIKSFFTPQPVKTTDE
jgi:hypothetical protein